MKLTLNRLNQVAKENGWLLIGLEHIGLSYDAQQSLGCEPTGFRVVFTEPKAKRKDPKDEILKKGNE